MGTKHDYKELVHYKILKESDLEKSEKAPKIGESISFFFDDDLEDNWITAIVGRETKPNFYDNFVKYFKSLEQLYEYLDSFELEINKDFGLQKIEELNQKI